MKRQRLQRKKIRQDLSEFKNQRLAMKMVSIFSIVIGGTLPMTFWNINDISATNPLSQVQLGIFIWFIYCAIINIVFGIIIFKQANELEDNEIKSKSNFYIFCSPLLLTGGSLPMGALFIHNWYKIKK